MDGASGQRGPGGGEPATDGDRRHGPDGPSAGRQESAAGRDRSASGDSSRAAKHGIGNGRGAPGSSAGAGPHGRSAPATLIVQDSTMSIGPLPPIIDATSHARHVDNSARAATTSQISSPAGEKSVT